MTFAERCITSRTGMGLSQETAARGIGISLRGYQNWESGAEPSLSKAIRAARFFDWPLDYLQQMGWTLNPPADLLVSGAA